MATMTIKEVEENVREALERVQKGEDIEITRDGEVIAVWMHPTRYRQQKRDKVTIEAERFMERLKRLQENPPPLDGKGISSEHAEQRVRELYEERQYDVWDRIAAEREESVS